MTDVAELAPDTGRVIFPFGRTTPCADCGVACVRVETASGVRVIEFESHPDGTVRPSDDVDRFHTVPGVRVTPPADGGTRWRFHDCTRARRPSPAAKPSGTDPTHCTFCALEFVGDEPRYEHVTGWARVRRAGGAHGLRAKISTARYACDACVDKLAHGRLHDDQLPIPSQ